MVPQGTITEDVYIDELKKLWGRGAVDVKACDQDPISVVRYAVKLKRKAIKEGVPYESIWAVIDTEETPILEQFEKAKSLARANGIKIALSTPCFELWLILHREYTTGAFDNYQATADKLTELLGEKYKKDNKSARRLLPGMVKDVESAISRTERLRKHHEVTTGTPFPNPYTDMDDVVKDIKKKYSDDD